MFLLVQSLFLTDFLFYGRNTEINNGQDYHLYKQQVILTIVYNLLNNIVYYIYIHLLYLFNNHLVFYMWVFIGVEYLCYNNNNLDIRLLPFDAFKKRVKTHLYLKYFAN